MHLELSKSELERLLELAYLGEEVLNGHGPDGERSAEHDVALDKLHDLAEEDGLGYLVDRGEDGASKPSMALETRMEAAGWLQDYDDCVFWDELALRLAERDLREEIGAHAFDALPAAERKERVDAIAEAYDKEFDDKGVERLRLPSGKRAPSRRTRDVLTERLKKLFKDSR
ncbi:MAG: hypothetical protein AAB554_05330 [Patescibacteria group bacterium]